MRCWRCCRWSGVWRGEGDGPWRRRRLPVRPADRRVARRRRLPELGSARSWRLSESGEYERPGPARVGILAVRRRPGRSVGVPGHRTAARAFRRLRRAVLRQSAQPVVLGAGHRRVGAQQVRACSSAAPSGSTASSRAATWRTSRSGWTPTAGWCRICRPGSRGSSVDAGDIAGRNNRRGRFPRRVLVQRPCSPGVVDVGPPDRPRRFCALLERARCAVPTGTGCWAAAGRRPRRLAPRVGGVLVARTRAGRLSQYRPQTWSGPRAVVFLVWTNRGARGPGDCREFASAGG